jgi:putative GTP pyrophosphokinase
MFKERDIKLALEDEMVPKYMEPIVDQLPQFIIMRNTYDCAIREVQTKLDNLDNEFRVRYDYNPIHHMERRLKIPASIEEKLQRLGKEISIEAARDNIFDIAGIRVVCNFVDDVYHVRDMLVAQQDVTLITEKDYIKNPKDNGYRSLHLVVSVPVYLMSGMQNVPVEIQIRTVAMDFWASLEHNLRYKKTKDIPRNIDIELKACAEVSAKLDARMQKIFDELGEIE